MKLETLPIEILTTVIEQLPYKDLANVQSTCRTLRTIAWPMLWENVQIEFPYSLEMGLQGSGSGTEVSNNHNISILQRYLKRYQSNEVPILADPYIHDPAGIRGWLTIREIDLVVLKKRPVDYQKSVLNFIKRFRIIAGSLNRFEKSEEWEYLTNFIIPSISQNYGLKSFDFGAKLAFYREFGKTGDMIADIIGNNQIPVNIEIMAGVLTTEKRLFINELKTTNTWNVKVLKCQIRKSLGKMFEEIGKDEISIFPKTLEVLELSSVSSSSSSADGTTDQMNTKNMKLALSKCPNLWRIVLKGYFGIDSDDIDWIPESVISLDIAYYGPIDRIDEIEKVTKNNIKELVVCYQLISSIAHYEFPNLEYLQVWDIFGGFASQPNNNPESVAALIQHYINLTTNLVHLKHLDLGGAFQMSPSSSSSAVLQHLHVPPAAAEEREEQIDSDGVMSDGIYEQLYYTYINAYKNQLVSLVSKSPPLYLVRLGYFQDLEYFVLDALRDLINWKLFIDFIKETKSLKEVIVLTRNKSCQQYDNIEPLPKFLLRFMNTSSNDKTKSKHELELSAAEYLLKTHRCMEACELYKVDIKAVRDCEYL